MKKQKSNLGSKILENLINRHKYNTDFLPGYIVHLLVDVYCSMHIFAPFVKSIKDDYEEKMTQYKRESYIVNYYLFSLFLKKHTKYTTSRERRDICWCY